MTEPGMVLETLGWSSFFAAHFHPSGDGNHTVARVAIRERADTYVLFSAYGELRGESSGRLRFMAAGPQDLPVVGDWVVIQARPDEQAATIQEVLPRRTKFSRKVVGKKTEEQVITANIDVAFLVSGLDGDFNPRRIERYLLLTAESGAQPVIVLNKMDLCDNLEECIEETVSLSGGAPVIAISAKENRNLEALREFFPAGTTAALLGSSGVGKSAIINRLLGSDVMATQPVRESDSRGRHTTTRRELLPVPGGGLLIDTPGMRELQLWGGSDGIDDAFEDVAALAATCRFSDCRHTNEPGCAVLRAIDEGTLDPGRFENYLKLQREIEYQKKRQSRARQLAEKERVKKLTYRHKRNYRRDS